MLSQRLIAPRLTMTVLKPLEKRLREDVIEDVDFHGHAAANGTANPAGPGLERTPAGAPPGKGVGSRFSLASVLPVPGSPPTSPATAGRNRKSEKTTDSRPHFSFSEGYDGRERRGVMRANLLPVAAASLVCLLSAPAMAQWINYPTPGIPRLPDGKPNLAASDAPDSGRQAGSVRDLARRPDR